jgi:hypothetical protein
MYLIPIGKASEKYLPYIYNQNLWLNINKQNNKARPNSFVHTMFIIRFINWGAYVAQIIFMVLARHSPEIDVLRDRYRKGRIEFFPSDFKRKVLEKI